MRGAVGWVGQLLLLLLLLTALLLLLPPLPRLLLVKLLLLLPLLTHTRCVHSPRRCADSRSERVLPERAAPALLGVCVPPPGGRPGGALEQRRARGVVDMAAFAEAWAGRPCAAGEAGVSRPPSADPAPWAAPPGAGSALAGAMDAWLRHVVDTSRVDAWVAAGGRGAPVAPRLAPCCAVGHTNGHTSLKRINEMAGTGGRLWGCTTGAPLLRAVFDAIGAVGLEHAVWPIHHLWAAAHECGKRVHLCRRTDCAPGTEKLVVMCCTSASGPAPMREAFGKRVRVYSCPRGGPRGGGGL